MIEIPLGGPRTKYRGVAIVDDPDYDLVSQYRWCISSSRTTSRVNYAVSGVRRADGAWTTLKMHRLITGFRLTDHIDGDGLNNRRTNLRPATDAQNQRNRRGNAIASSRYKGVSLHTCGRWVAQIEMRPIYRIEYDFSMSGGGMPTAKMYYPSKAMAMKAVTDLGRRWEIPAFDSREAMLREFPLTDLARDFPALAPSGGGQ